MNQLIFQDPFFVRKNSLVNLLYSNFPVHEFTDQINTNNFSDVLRANYHSLSLENLPKDRRYILSFSHQVLQFNFSECSELDWFYLERCILHYINLQRPFSQQITHILERNYQHAERNHLNHSL